MKTLIIYTSQTGFTKKYAQWIAEKVSGDLLDQKDARKKSREFFDEYDAICYGGWAMAGSVVKSKWFLEKAADLKSKRLAMFCVGGSPSDNPDVDAYLQNALTEEEKKYIKLFYCPGGFNYATEKEKVMAEKMSSSYDISDIKYIEPIVSYLEEAGNEKN